MKYMIVLLLLSSCGPRIIQRVDNCEDQTHYRVNTYINEGQFPNVHTIYDFDTYYNAPYEGRSCLEAWQLDSVKKSEYKKAEEWLKNRDDPDTTHKHETPQAPLAPKPKIAIKQDVSNCGDESHFQVDTWGWYNGDIIYYNNWGNPYMDQCATLADLPKIKQKEYAKAERFIENYNKIK